MTETRIEESKTVEPNLPMYKGRGFWARVVVNCEVPNTDKTIGVVMVAFLPEGQGAPQEWVGKSMEAEIHGFSPGETH